MDCWSLRFLFLEARVGEDAGFRKHLERVDDPALWAYVTWLRTPGSQMYAEPMEEHHHD